MNTELDSETRSILNRQYKELERVVALLIYKMGGKIELTFKEVEEFDYLIRVYDAPSKDKKVIEVIRNAPA